MFIRSSGIYQGAIVLGSLLKLKPVEFRSHECIIAFYYLFITVTVFIYIACIYYCHCYYLPLWSLAVNVTEVERAG